MSPDTEIKRLQALLDFAESDAATRVREVERRRSEDKRELDRLRVEFERVKRENAMLKKTSQAAADRQKKRREDQLDLEDSTDAVRMWRTRYQEQGRELFAAQQTVARHEQTIATWEELALRKQDDAEALKLANDQLHAALLGARERIRTAEKARDAAQAPEGAVPPCAPETWTHTITIGEHLKALAEVQRKIERGDA